MEIRERKLLCILNRDQRHRGIYIYEDDLQVIKQVFIHRVIRSVSIHEYYGFLSGWNRSRSAISNRIGKLRDAGILILMKQPILNHTFETFYYKLGKRGLEVLQQLGVLDAADFEREYLVTRQARLPGRHNTAISLIANKSVIACSSNPRIKSYDHCRGSNHPAFDGSKGDLVPDWVFYTDNRIICLECDTGHQRQHMIQKKYMSYMAKAEEMNAKGITMIVVFTVIDESIDKFFSHNRERRLTALKESAPPAMKWPADVNGYSDYGIHFYAVTGKRTPPLISRMLSEENPLTVLERSRYVIGWQETAAIVLSNYYEMRVVEKESVLEPRRSNKVMDCDLVFEWEVKTDISNLQPKTHLVYVVYGEEGSVLTQQMIGANIKRLNSINSMQHYSSASLLVCYSDPEQAQDDVLGISLGDSTYRITDVDSWESALYEKKSAPKVLLVTSTFAKTWKEFDVV